MSDILSNMDRDFGDKTAAGPSEESTNNSNGVSEPRRSARVNADTSGDGDSWQEKLMVCEAAGNKLVIRSYFRSTKSGQRVWDEPPTGASHIEAASAADRQKAEEELKNLQLAMDINSAPAADDKKSKSSKKGKGLFSVFRKKKDKSNESSSSGGVFGKKKTDNKISKHTSTSAVEADTDEDLQRAISLSMGITPGGKNEDTAAARINGTNSWQAEDEALEMAKAISMSEAEASKPPAEHSFAEDEMLQRAIEESRRHTTEVASIPGKESELFGFMDNSSSQNVFSQPAGNTNFADDSEFLNQKMPAKSKSDYDDDFFNQKEPAQSSAEPAPSSPPNAYAMFDPYANNSNPPPAAAAAAAATLKNPPPDGQPESSDSQGLRKMESPTGGKRSSGMGLGLRFGKKHLQDDAGIV